MVEWQKDGDVLLGDDHIVISRAKEECELRIDHACAEDSGEYTVTAANDEGETSASVNVVVNLPVPDTSESRSISAITEVSEERTTTMTEGSEDQQQEETGDEEDDKKADDGNGDDGKPGEEAAAAPEKAPEADDKESPTIQRKTVEGSFKIDSTTSPETKQTTDSSAVDTTTDSEATENEVSSIVSEVAPVVLTKLPETVCVPVGETIRLSVRVTGAPC